jgi:hypothetical protein
MYIDSVVIGVLRKRGDRQDIEKSWRGTKEGKEAENCCLTTWS